ncbi:hypothetical protein ACLMAL_05625 [Nocardia sp. CWNU-33]|uniref:hypothetical protein n=1 Tax=Nocardia sp. CWNU-33 TaxID=3392117 RepID=UPI00398F2D50
MAEQLLPGVPPGVQNMMFGYMPDAKIEGMRRAADAWSDSANRLAGVLHGIEASQARAVAAAANGFTAEAIRKQYGELAEGTRRLMKYSDSMAEQLYEAATEFELEKYMVIGIASVLAAQLSWDLAMGFAGVAPAAAHRAAAGAAMSLAWRRLMVAMAVRGAVIGGLMMGGVRGIAEGIQVAHGDREAVDWKAVRIAATAGAVGGGFGGAVGSVVAPAVTRLGANAVSKTAQNGWRVAAVVAAGVSGGAVGGLTGGLTAGYLTGNYGNLADMVLMGIGGGLVGGLGAGYRSVRTAGYSGVSVTGDSRNRAASDLGGIEHTPSSASEPVTGAGEGQAARPDGITPEMMAAGKEAEAVVVRDLTPENIANMKPREARAANELVKNRTEPPGGARRFEPINEAKLDQFEQMAQAGARAELDKRNLGEIRLPLDAPGRPPSPGTPPATLGHGNVHPPQIVSPHPSPPPGGGQLSPGARNATGTVFAPAEGSLGRPTASTGQVIAPEGAVRTSQDGPGPGAVADAPTHQRPVAEATPQESGARVENEGKIAGKPEESGHVSTTEEVAAADIELALPAESTSTHDNSVSQTGQDAPGNTADRAHGDSPPAGDGSGEFVPAQEVAPGLRNCVPEASSRINEHIKEQTGKDAFDLSEIGDRTAGSQGVSGDRVARALRGDWLTYRSPQALIEHAQRTDGSIFGGVQFKNAGAHAFAVIKNAQGHIEVHEQVGNMVRKISGDTVEHWRVDTQGRQVGEKTTKRVENAVEQWLQDLAPHVESTHGIGFNADGTAALPLKPGEAPRGHGPRDPMKGYQTGGGADVLERPASKLDHSEHVLVELEFRRSKDAFEVALAEIRGEGPPEATPSAPPHPTPDPSNLTPPATPKTIPDATPPSLAADTNNPAPQADTPRPVPEVASPRPATEAKNHSTRTAAPPVPEAASARSPRVTTDAIGVAPPAATPKVSNAAPATPPHATPDAINAAPQAATPKVSNAAPATPPHATPDALNAAPQAATPKVSNAAPATPPHDSNSIAVQAAASKTDHTAPAAPVLEANSAAAAAVSPRTAPDLTPIGAISDPNSPIAPAVSPKSALPTSPQHPLAEVNNPAVQANQPKPPSDPVPSTFQHARTTDSAAPLLISPNAVPHDGLPASDRLAHPGATRTSTGPTHPLGTMTGRPDVDERPGDPEESPRIKPSYIPDPRPDHFQDPHKRNVGDVPEELPIDHERPEPGYITLPGVSGAPEQEQPRDIEPLIPKPVADPPGHLPAITSRRNTSPFIDPEESDDRDSGVSPSSDPEPPPEITHSTPFTDRISDHLSADPATRTHESSPPHYSPRPNTLIPGGPQDPKTRPGFHPDDLGYNRDISGIPQIGGLPPRQLAKPGKPVEQRRPTPWATATMGDEPDRRKKRRPANESAPPPQDPVNPHAPALVPAVSEPMEAKIERLHGIPVHRQQAIQEYANKHNLIITVRPTNPDAVARINAGLPGKPELVKSKSINDLDVELGAKPGSQGLVGYFVFPESASEPGELRLPPRDGVSEEHWNQLVKRLDERRAEYAALRASMDKHIHKGRFVVREGIVHGRNDADEFLPLTGDHDLFDIRHAGGSRLSPLENFQHFDQAHLADMGVQHPPLAYWNPTSQADWDMYIGLMSQHGANGVPLVQFRPDQDPVLTQVTPAERAEIAKDRAVVLKQALNDTEVRLDQLIRGQNESLDQVRELLDQARNINQMIAWNSTELSLPAKEGRLRPFRRRSGGNPGTGDPGVVSYHDLNQFQDVFGRPARRRIGGPVAGLSKRDPFTVYRWDPNGDGQDYGQPPKPEAPGVAGSQEIDFERLWLVHEMVREERDSTVEAEPGSTKEHSDHAAPDKERAQRLNSMLGGLGDLLALREEPPTAITTERRELLTAHFDAVTQWLAALINANNLTEHIDASNETPLRNPSKMAGPEETPQLDYLHRRAKYVSYQKRMQADAVYRHLVAERQVADILARLASAQTGNPASSEDLRLLANIEAAQVESVLASVATERRSMPRGTPGYERLSGMLGFLNRLSELMDGQQPGVTSEQLGLLVDHFDAALEWEAASIYRRNLTRVMDEENLTKEKFWQVRDVPDHQLLANEALDRYRAADARVRALAVELAAVPSAVAPDSRIAVQSEPAEPKVRKGGSPATERPRSRVWADHGSAAGFSDKGLKPKPNQDAFEIVTEIINGDPVTMVMVFDGVGSSQEPHRAPEVAAKAGREAFQAAAADATTGGRFDPLATVRAVTEAANAAVIEQAAEYPPGEPTKQYPEGRPHPLCTVVVALVQAGRISVDWVGDTRAYWLAFDGGPSFKLTKDDSEAERTKDAARVARTKAKLAAQAAELGKGGPPAEALKLARVAAELDLKAKLAEKQAVKKQNSHGIYRCLGYSLPESNAKSLAITQFTPERMAEFIDGSVEEREKIVETTIPSLTGSGILLVVTDGVWDRTPAANALASIVSAHLNNLLAAARALWQRAMQTGGHDNITSVLVRHEGFETGIGSPERVAVEPNGPPTPVDNCPAQPPAPGKSAVGRSGPTSSAQTRQSPGNVAPSSHYYPPNGLPEFNLSDRRPKKPESAKDRFTKALMGYHHDENDPRARNWGEVQNLRDREEAGRSDPIRKTVEEAVSDPVRAEQAPPGVPEDAHSGDTPRSESAPKTPWTQRLSSTGEQGDQESAPPSGQHTAPQPDPAPAPEQSKPTPWQRATANQARQKESSAPATAGESENTSAASGLRPEEAVSGILVTQDVGEIPVRTALGLGDSADQQPDSPKKVPDQAIPQEVSTEGAAKSAEVETDPGGVREISTRSDNIGGGTETIAGAKNVAVPGIYQPHPGSDSTIEQEISELQAALGLHTPLDLLLEVTLYIEDKFRDTAIVAGQDLAEIPRLFGDKEWLAWMKARSFTLQNLDQDLSVSFIQEVHALLCLQITPEHARDFAEAKNPHHGKLAWTPSEYERSALEENPWLTYIPGPFWPWEHGYVLFPAVEGQPGARQLRVLSEPLTEAERAVIDADPLLGYVPAVPKPHTHGVILYPNFGGKAGGRAEVEAMSDWYNEARRTPGYDPYKLAAELQYRSVSGHTGKGDFHGRLSRILMNWSLAKDGEPPSAIPEFDNDLFTRRQDWVAVVRASSMRYQLWKTQVEQQGAVVDPVTLFGLAQLQQRYRQIGGAPSPFIPGRLHDITAYQRLHTWMTSDGDPDTAPPLPAPEEALSEAEERGDLEVVPPAGAPTATELPTGVLGQLADPSPTAPANHSLTATDDTVATIRPGKGAIPPGLVPRDAKPPKPRPPAGNPKNMPHKVIPNKPATEAETPADYGIYPSGIQDILIQLDNTDGNLQVIKSSKAIVIKEYRKFLKSGEESTHQILVDEKIAQLANTGMTPVDAEPIARQHAEDSIRSDRVRADISRFATDRTIQWVNRLNELRKNLFEIERRSSALLATDPSLTGKGGDQWRKGIKMLRAILTTPSTDRIKGKDATGLPITHKMSNSDTIANYELIIKELDIEIRLAEDFGHIVSIGRHTEAANQAVSNRGASPTSVSNPLSKIVQRALTGGAGLGGDPEASEHAARVIFTRYARYRLTTERTNYYKFLNEYIEKLIHSGESTETAERIAKQHAESYIRRERTQDDLNKKALARTEKWVNQNLTRASRAGSDPISRFAMIWQYENNIPSELSPDLNLVQRTPIDRLGVMRDSLDEFDKRVATLLAKMPHLADHGADKWLTFSENIRYAIADLAADFFEGKTETGQPITEDKLDIGRILGQDANIQGLLGEIQVAEQFKRIDFVGKIVHLDLPGGRRITSEVDIVADGGRTWVEVKSISPNRQVDSLGSLVGQARERLRIANENPDYLRGGRRPRQLMIFTDYVDVEAMQQIEAVEAPGAPGYRFKVTDLAARAAAAAAAADKQTPARRTHSSGGNAFPIGSELDLDPNSHRKPYRHPSVREQIRRVTELNVFGGGWVRGGPQPEPQSTLPPSVRNALETAENEANEVVAEALREAKALGADTTDIGWKDPAAIDQLFKNLKVRQGYRYGAVLRRLVADELLFRVLADDKAVPKAREQYLLLKPHIDAFRRYVTGVREALAVMVARQLPPTEDAVMVAEGVWMVRGERVVVMSPLLGQQRMLDTVAPALREWAVNEGIPIEYLRVQIDDEGQLSVEPVSGVYNKNENLRYYTDRDDIFWMNSLTDERSFTEKLADAQASGERTREVLKSTVADDTMSQQVVLIIYNNGYMVIEKTVRTKEHADAEELGSLTARNVGAHAAEVLRVSDLVVLVQFVPGVLADELGIHGIDGWQHFFNLPSARRAGLGDTLTRPWDRHEGKNWLLEHLVHAVVFDFSNGFEARWPAGGFAYHFLELHNRELWWKEHLVPPAELEADRQRIIASESAFVRRRQPDWYREVLEIFAIIEANAKQDIASPSTDPADAVKILTELRDDLAYRLGLDDQQASRAEREQMIADLRLELRNDETMLGHVDILDRLTKVLLHAQLKEVSAEELDDDKWPGLTEKFLEGLAQRIADLETGARYPNPNGESDEEWQARFEHEIQATINESVPDNGSPTDSA